MKKTHIATTATAFIVGLTLVISLLTGSARAAAGQIYLTPSTKSIDNGSTFTVTLRANPGTGADVVNASVSYDSGKLSLESISCSGSPFSTSFGCSKSNPAVVSLASLADGNGVAQPVTTDSFVATLSFKALTGTGTSSISVSGDLANGGSSIGASTAGAVVTFTTPASPPPTDNTGGGSTGGGGSTSGSGSGTGSGSTGGTATGNTDDTDTGSTDETKSEDTELSVDTPDVQFTIAKLVVTTPQPARVHLQFGTDKNGLTDQTEPDELGTTHNISIDPSKLIPGETYYYVLVSEDASGNVVKSELKSFKTKGLTISVTVTDKNRNPIKNKLVTLHSDPVQAKTDSKGVATFTDVIPGDHHVVYEAGGKKYDQQVSVVNNVVTTGDAQNAPVQNLSVVYASLTQQSNAYTRYAMIAVLLVAVAAVAAVVLRRKAQYIAPFAAPLTSESIVVGGTSPNQSNTVASVQTPQPGISDRLSGIPTPNQPSPGTTVAPAPQDDNGQNRGQQ